MVSRTSSLGEGRFNFDPVGWSVCVFQTRRYTFDFACCCCRSVAAVVCVVLCIQPQFAVYFFYLMILFIFYLFTFVSIFYLFLPLTTAARTMAAPPEHSVDADADTDWPSSHGELERAEPWTNGEFCPWPSVSFLEHVCATAAHATRLAERGLSDEAARLAALAKQPIRYRAKAKMHVSVWVFYYYFLSCSSCWWF